MEIGYEVGCLLDVCLNKINICRWWFCDPSTESWVSICKTFQPKYQNISLIYNYTTCRVSTKNIKTKCSKHPGLLCSASGCGEWWWKGGWREVLSNSVGLMCQPGGWVGRVITVSKCINQAANGPYKSTLFGLVSEYNDPLDQGVFFKTYFRSRTKWIRTYILVGRIICWLKLLGWWFPKVWQCTANSCVNVREGWHGFSVSVCMSKFTAMHNAPTKSNNVTTKVSREVFPVSSPMICLFRVSEATTKLHPARMAAVLLWRRLMVLHSSHLAVSKRLGEDVWLLWAKWLADGRLLLNRFLGRRWVDCV